MQHLLGHTFFSAQFPLFIAEIQQWAIPEHSHDFFEMVYVRRGRGQHFIDGNPFPIQAGDLYAISPGERHRYEPAAGSSLRIVNVLWMPDLVEKSLRADDTLQGAQKLLYVEPLLEPSQRFEHCLHLEGSQAYRVEALLDEMRREQSAAAPGSELMLRHLFCALLVLLSRAYDARSTAQQTRATRATPQSGVVAQAIAYIEAHSGDTIRVADVAAHTAMSPSRLSHLFKEHTQHGIIEYLHQFRMARVCAALLGDDLPIQDIARAAGYSDMRFFHRIFRRHTGCNPRQFRQHFGAV